MKKEKGETYVKWATKLKEEVRNVIEQVEDPLEGLEMVDDLQRLGVFYHFECEIKRLLDKTYTRTKDEWKKDDLYATALKFRLFRQHGYDTSQEVFNNFRDEMGNFKAHLSEDIKVALLVSHALEVPLHWRVLRLEARWFIDVYMRRPSMNPALLWFAKLDYNIVQATYQEDLKHVSRWWKRIGLAEKLSFARDRLMENFLWNVGVNFKPQFGHFRRTMTVVYYLITVIDDVYDVYGTLDELELFTDVVQRWDTSGKMDELPPYMKTCFLALFDSVNEIGLDNLKKHGVEVTPFLHKMWADLCTHYLVEAKWYHSGYTPTFDEYINHARISISAPVILSHAYFLCTNSITKEALQYLEKSLSLVRWPSTILRLANDLGTSQHEMKRGDVPKSIQCFMQETGASEEEAREHIRQLIEETWKKMNKDRFAVPFFSQAFIEVAINLARMSQCMYRHGDGHGAQGHDSQDRVMSLIVNPIP
ncbi:(-)-alpha-terpineol synthase [Bertholletia excelsa]